MYKQILYSIKRINYGFDKTFYFVLIFATSILLISCGNQRNSENNKVEETANENDTSITIESNSDTTNKALLKLISGIYHGVQEEYNMKNKFGDDVIIGAGSVIIENISSNSKIVGNPGRIIK
jgi:hypothetical protein